MVVFLTKRKQIINGSRTVKRESFATFVATAGPISCRMESDVNNLADRSSIIDVANSSLPKTKYAAALSKVNHSNWPLYRRKKNKCSTKIANVVTRRWHRRAVATAERTVSAADCPPDTASRSLRETVSLKRSSAGCSKSGKAWNRFCCCSMLNRSSGTF